jgi:hypothetical protein
MRSAQLYNLQRFCERGIVVARWPCGGAGRPLVIIPPPRRPSPALFSVSLSSARRPALSTSIIRLSALILLYFSTLKGIFHPGQRGFLLYPIILRGHNYSIYLPYTNYHIPPSTVCTRPFSRFATRWGQHIKSQSLIGPSTALHAPLPTPVPMVSLAHVCVDAGFGVLELERDNRVAYPAPHCSPPLHAKILAQPFQLPLRAA